MRLFDRLRCSIGDDIFRTEVELTLNAKKSKQYLPIDLKKIFFHNSIHSFIYLLIYCFNWFNIHREYHIIEKYHTLKKGFLEGNVTGYSRRDGSRTEGQTDRIR